MDSPSGRRGGGSATGRQSNDRLRFLGSALAASAGGRRRRAAARTTGAGRLPPVTCGAVLNKPRVRAHRVAAQILLPGVAVVLAELERRIADLDQRILIARIVLLPAGE